MYHISKSFLRRIQISLSLPISSLVVSLFLVLLLSIFSPFCLNDVDCKFLNEGPSDQQEKAMAPHSSTFAWKIPWTEEPGGLQSMGSLRVGHD